MDDFYWLSEMSDPMEIKDSTMLMAIEDWCSQNDHQYSPILTDLFRAIVGEAKCLNDESSVVFSAFVENCMFPVDVGNANQI